MQYQDVLLDEIEKELLCTDCTDWQGFSFKKPKGEMDRIDYYLKEVPGASYILGQKVNFIFSNGLTTGKTDGDRALDDFLFRENEQAATNYSVLQDAVRMAEAYGEAGLREYENNLYLVPTGTYATLTQKVDGIKQIVGYITTKNGKRIEKDTFDFTDFKWDGDISLEDILKDFDEKGWIFLDKTKFRNIRNNTTEEHGKSPFLEDTLRLDLLITTYKRLIHDLNYDGPGRVLFWTKGGLAGDSENDVATSQVINQSANIQEERRKRAKKEFEQLAKDIKESKSDSAIMLSSEAFDKDIKHLERVTKSTEFLEWIKEEGLIVAQILGMAPGLLELGSMSGNVSMEKIIDNAMLNTIVPLRERYAVQFSVLLRDLLGVEKVYFNKYELQQAEDVNTMRTKIVNDMSLLSAMKDENGVIRPEAQELFSNFAQMLNKELHQDGNINGELKELKVSKKGEQKNEQQNERNIR